jgi:hypothetical protein
MYFYFKPFDDKARFDIIDIVDRLTGRVVGYIRSRAPSPGIDVIMSDAKYCATVDGYQECRGFVRGVETVLRRMTEATVHSVEKPAPVMRRAG